MAKEYQLKFVLGASLGSGATATFSKAEKSIASLQKEILQLNKHQADITSYQKQQQAVTKATEKYKTYEAQLENVRAEMEQSGTYSSSLANKELALQKKIHDVQSEIAEKTAKLKKMGEALDDAGIDTDELAKETERLEKELKDCKQAQEEFGKQGTESALSVGDALVAAGVATTLKEIYDWYSKCVTESAAWAGQVDEVSKLYGIDTDTLQSLYYAAELVDVSVETIVSSIQKSVKSMGEAKEGSAAYAEAYKTLGVSVTDTNGNLRDGMEVYWETIDALGQMTNDAERDSLAMQLMGRSAMQLNSLISAGSGTIKEFSEKAHDAGFVMSNEMLEVMCQLDDEIMFQQKNVKALSNTIGAAFAPEISSVLRISNDILANITTFAQEHPIITKSLIAIGAEAGVIVGAYTAYNAVKKASNSLKAIGIALGIKNTTTKIGETAATSGLTFAQKALNAAMAAAPILGVITLVATLTVEVIALTEANKANESELEQLTAISRENYAQLQSATAEYEKAVEMYGEASYQAQELAWEVDALTASYEANKKTLTEYLEECEGLNNSYGDLLDTNRKTIDSLDIEEEKTLNLINRLEVLANQNSRTVESNEEMKAIIDALNQSLPELSLNYQDVINNSADFSIAVENYVKAQAAAERYQEAQKGMIDAYNAQYELEKQLLSLEEEKKLKEFNYAVAAENYRKYGIDGNKARKLNKELGKINEQYIETKSNLEQAKIDYSEYLSILTDGYGSELGGNSEAIIDQKNLNKALADIKSGYLSVAQAAKMYGVSETSLQAKADESTEAKDNLKKAMDAIKNGYYSLSQAAQAYGFTEAQLQAGMKVHSITSELETLQEAYEATYEAAEQTVKGQFDIWDEAAVIVITDINKINSALETQMAYWHDYTVDLENLSKRSIPGLDEVIAAHSSGSQEDISFIASIANANDEELKKLVEMVNELDEYQKKAIDSSAEMATGYSQKYAELTKELENTVALLNIDNEAKNAAEATMDAYVKALEDGGADAVAAAADIAMLVSQALGGSVGYGGGIGAFSVFARAYAGGTSNAAPGAAIVGENGPELAFFNGGERVWTAARTKQAMTASHGGMQITIAPQFTITGGVDSDTEEQVRVLGDEIVEMVLDALAEAGVDAQRGAYV